MNTLIELLSMHEGRKNAPYKDSLGYWTIGVGHLIDMRKGATLSGIRSIPMTEDNIDAVLNLDIVEHSAGLFTAAPWVKKLDAVRQAVLIDMAFNLGVAGLMEFKRTLASIQSGDYATAATQMLQSTWAHQVGTRATRLAEMMRTGKWPA